MIRATCPSCRRQLEAESIRDLPAFPFCSTRCRTIDQARWVDEEFVVSRPLEPTDLDDEDIDSSIDSMID
jgi:uncharacterized protein